MTPIARAALTGLLFLAAATPATAVTLGQVDDFEDGTTQGWVVAFGPGGGVHPVPPQAIGTGGPQGADDGYLLLSAIGGPAAGGRLTAGNLSQWTGDYLAAGVDRIGMWVNNFGPTDLLLRLLVEGPMGAPPSNIAFSADPVAVTAGTGWQQIAFSLDPADLIAGLGTVEGALSNTTTVRLFHGSADAFPGEPVAAQLGVDDISALAAVPEPATWALLIAGFGAVGAMLRRGDRSGPHRLTAMPRGRNDLG